MIFSPEDSTRVQDLLVEAFDDVYDENILYTVEGLLARSSLILLWTVVPTMPQAGLKLLLRQVGENIEYIASLGYMDSETLKEILMLLSGEEPGELPEEEEEEFKNIIDRLQ